MSLKDDLLKSTKKKESTGDDQVNIEEEVKIEILDTPKPSTSTSTSSSTSTSTTTLKGEEVKTITFEELKTKIKKVCKEDRVLKRYGLNFVDEPIVLIIYQGVLTNVLARIRKSGSHLVQRSIIQKRLGDLLYLDIIEPKQE